MNTRRKCRYWSPAELGVDNLAYNATITSYQFDVSGYDTLVFIIVANTTSRIWGRMYAPGAPGTAPTLIGATNLWLNTATAIGNMLALWQGPGAAVFTGIAGTTPSVCGTMVGCGLIDIQILSTLGAGNVWVHAFGSGE